MTFLINVYFFIYLINLIIYLVKKNLDNDDDEGAELEILRTMDWKRLTVDVITVEYLIYGGHKLGVDKLPTLRKLGDLRQLFRSTGFYREVGVLPRGKDVDGLDVVFSRIPDNSVINANK